MKIKKASQHREAAAQRLQMVEQFRQSGLSRRTFSQQYGVPPATLSWCVEKKKHVSAPPALAVLFSEVKLASPVRSFDTGWEMEIIAPSGLMIRCRRQLEAQEIAKLMRVGTLRQLGPLTIQEISNNAAERTRFAAALAEFHYLGTVGENLQYAVSDATGRLLACLLFGSPAWKYQSRDEFIGWSIEQGQRRLNCITNNTRFLILPFVKVPHLAS